MFLYLSFNKEIIIADKLIVTAPMWEKLAGKM